MPAYFVVHFDGCFPPLSREERLQHQRKFPGNALHGDVTGYVASITN